ncbi:MAG: glycosyltransferase family 2 protein, partial [Bryobacteraceae bacterium]
TIESVLRQDYPHIEYIIMDGGSTDETAEVVREYTGRVRWISEKDRGQSHAINKGFRMAKGTIVAWINSDDIILPGAVSRAVAAFERKPRAGAVYGEGYTMDEHGKLTGRFEATEPFNLWKLVYLSDYILQQTVYFRKAVLDEVGYLDETLHYGMDWDILIRIGKRYPLEHVPEYMGCLREYADAKTFSGGGRRIRELKRMLQAHTGLRVPPGYVTYGLYSYQQEWRRKLEDSAPAVLRLPAKLAAYLIYLAAGYLTMRVVRNAQGWYPDGWASPAVKWMLPAGVGKAVIRGTVPPGNRELSGQTLSVFSRGRLLGRQKVESGDFEMIVPVHSEGGLQPVHFEIRASRYFLDPRWGKQLSLRRQSYVLQSVEWLVAEEILPA